jgi:acyl-CoA reductase-like NAD-dependent aldehyde dehydrogenase
MDTYYLNEGVKSFLERPQLMLINNRWTDAVAGGRIASLNPATGLSITEIPEGGTADVDRAVTAARYAFETGPWSKLTPDERGVLLWRLADLIEKHEEEFSQIDTLDNGAPQLFTRWIARAAVGAFRYYAGYANKLYGQATDIHNAAGSYHAYTRLEPIGVVGVITPWNGPLATICSKIAPALAAGCTVAVKPAELTSLSALRLGELALEAGFPEGALNIVTGYGPVAGQAIVDHPGVDKISFTGSTVTGKHLARCCTGNLKRITLELGGKSPMIVFADADLEKAIPLAARAIFANSGQVCFAGSRLFVEQPVYDKVVAGVAAIAQTLKLGDGFDATTDLGPLISQRQRERVLGYVQSGIEEGAEIIAGGSPVEGAGFFVKPTVFAATNPEMKICREEIFGPVVAVEPFTGEDDVIRRANATDYGLGSGICTENVGRAHRLARRIKAGNVWVNCYSVVSPRLPFGGYKESGWGREFGAEGIDSCLEKKTVHVSA